MYPDNELGQALENIKDTELVKEILAAYAKHNPAPGAKKKGVPSDANQMFISDFLSDFEKIKGSKGGVTLNYQNFLMLTKHMHSTLFMNNMTAIDKGQALLENIPRSVLGDLQPYFKFFLVYGMGPASYKEWPLPLNNFEGFSDMTSSRAGLGVSLKSFSWNFSGKHPGDVPHVIECKLKLYFESPDALFHVYPDPSDPGGEDVYGFASLLYRRAPRNLAGVKYTRTNLDSYGYGDNSHLNYNQNDHRVKVEIGYKPPPLNRLIDAFAGQSQGSSPQVAAANFRDALKENKTILYLTMARHTFLPIFSSGDFSFELDIDFIGSIEAAATADGANILIRKDKRYEKEQRALDKVFENLRSAVDKVVAYDPKHLEEVLHWDMSDFSGANDQEKLVSVKKEYHSLLGEDTVIQKKGLTLDQHNTNVENIFALMKHKGTKTQQEKKFFFSPVTKLERYRNMTCNLRDEGKIYNLKLDRKQFVQYINKREKFPSPKLSESGKKAAAEKLKILDMSDSERDKELAVKLQKLIRGHSENQDARAKFFGKMSQKFFPKTKPTFKELSTAPIDKRLKQLDKGLLQMQAAALRSGISADEYMQYIRNDVDPFSPDGGNKHLLYWIYYGDILDAVLETIPEDELTLDLWRADQNPRGTLKVILGNIEYIDRITKEPKIINIANVPIPLDVWEDFWFNKVVRTGRKRYFLRDFLFDSLGTLIPAVLTNRHRLPGEAAINFFPGVQQLTIPSENFNKEHRLNRGDRLGGYAGSIYDRGWYIGQYGIAPELEDDPLGLEHIPQLIPQPRLQRDLPGYEDDKGPRPPGGEEKLLYMFNARDTFGIGSRAGEKGKVADNKTGIYHIVIGQQNTPVYNVSFTKSHSPYWLEWQAFKSGFLKDNIHLSEPYHCKIELPGLTFIRPGTYIYIRFPIAWLGSPQQPGSPARALGMGGYFFIKETSNTLVLLPGGGKLEWRTTADAVWTNFGSTTKPAPTEGGVSP